jgi:hypothetical protein
MQSRVSIIDPLFVGDLASSEEEDSDVDEAELKLARALAKKNASAGIGDQTAASDEASSESSDGDMDVCSSASEDDSNGDTPMADGTPRTRRFSASVMATQGPVAASGPANRPSLVPAFERQGYSSKEIEAKVRHKTAQLDAELRRRSMNVREEKSKDRLAERLRILKLKKNSIAEGVEEEDKGNKDSEDEASDGSGGGGDALATLVGGEKDLKPLSESPSELPDRQSLHMALDRKTRGAGTMLRSNRQAEATLEVTQARRRSVLSKQLRMRLAQRHFAASSSSSSDDADVHVRVAAPAPEPVPEPVPMDESTEIEATVVALTAGAEESEAYDVAAVSDKKRKGRKHRKGSKAVMGAVKQINIDEDDPTKTAGVKKKKKKKKVPRKKSRAVAGREGDHVEVQYVHEEHGLQVLDKGSMDTDGKADAAVNSVLDLFALPDSYPVVGAIPVAVHIAIDCNNDVGAAAVTTDERGKVDDDGNDDADERQSLRKQMRQARKGSLGTKTTKTKTKPFDGHKMAGVNDGKASKAKVSIVKGDCHKKSASAAASGMDTGGDGESEGAGGGRDDYDYEVGLGREALEGAPYSETDEDVHADIHDDKLPTQNVDRRPLSTAASNVPSNEPSNVMGGEGEGDGASSVSDDEAMGSEDA